MEEKFPISFKDSARFLNDIKDVPIPQLLIGLGFILIIGGWAISKITGNNELMGVGLIFAVFGLVAYQNKRTKAYRKSKRRAS